MAVKRWGVREGKRRIMVILEDMRGWLVVVVKLNVLRRTRRRERMFPRVNDNRLCLMMAWEVALLYFNTSLMIYMVVYGAMHEPDSIYSHIEFFRPIFAITVSTRSVK